MKTPSGSNNAPTAKRPETASRPDENSVTFSLSALMAQGNQAPTPPAKAALKDDSGLIDLNALTAMEDSARKSPLPAHIGLFPFEAPTLTAAPAPAPVVQATEEDAPPKPKRSWIWLGGAGVALAAVAAFYVGMNGGSGDHAAGAPTTTVAAVETAPPIAAAAALEATKPADPSKVAAADPGASKDKAPPPVVSAKAATPPIVGKGKLVKADTAEKAEKKDPPPAAKLPSSPNDPCHGDLMCAMQHAASK